MSINSIGFTRELAGSGIFHKGGFAPMSNPGLLIQPDQHKVLAYDWSKDRKELEQLSPKKWPLASTHDFDEYARKIITVAECLVDFEPHCSVGPLRGSSFPSSLAAVTTNNHVTFDFFNFRTGSPGKK